MKTRKTRYGLIRRGIRSGVFYCVDTNTGKRIGLRTGNEDAARQNIEAINQAERQPVLNLETARAYLAGPDNGIVRVRLSASGLSRGRGVVGLSLWLGGWAGRLRVLRCYCSTEHEILN